MPISPSHPDAIWPVRTWVLAVLAALIALAIQQLSDIGDVGPEWQRRAVAALPVFLGVAGLAFGLIWRRERLVGPIIVALLCGLISGSVFMWHGAPNDGWNADMWRVACGVFAAGALITLFQAAQDRVFDQRAAARPAGWSLGAIRTWKRSTIRYPDVHGHLWTSALLVAASSLFMLLSFAIAHLLAEMFHLVKLDFLRIALREDAFVALLCGAAFGAALGLLRDRGAVITALQRVAMLVLRILAPVLAVGILVFLAALHMTGLTPLWETGGTTPIMLIGAMLAVFLANAVVSDQPGDESRSTFLSASAAALSLFLLPMVGIAVYSSGLRIEQHGLSPDRLWALAFLIVASITAVAYAVAILGRRGWFTRLRATNLRLIFMLAAIALLLSTPLVSFDRIATAHQLSRLSNGQVLPDDFDYKGLWFDFGPPGRAALTDLAINAPNPMVRRFANETRKLKTRWEKSPNATLAGSGEALDQRLTILPVPIPLDATLRSRLIAHYACGPKSDCILRYIPGDDFAIIVQLQPDCERCDPFIRLLRQQDGRWLEDSAYLSLNGKAAAMVAAIRAGQVDMRPVERRQLFIGGEAVGETLPPPSPITAVAP